MTESEDALRRTKLAADFAEQMLKSVRTGEEGAALALVGPWGSGKSWLLNRISQHLRAQGDIDVINFRPWLYSDEAALYGGFAFFLDAISFGKRRSRRFWHRARHRFYKMMRALDPSFSLSLGPLASIGVRLFGGGSSVDPPAEVRRLLQTALKRSVIVVIDDIDRLTPAELLTLFKLLRLTSDIPRLRFLLVYDDQTIRQLLASTDVAGQSEERAREYLEKIVQRRWDVPLLSEHERGLILWDRLPTFGSGLADEAGSTSISDRLRRLADQAITTPRAAARYVDAARAAQQDLQGEVVASEMYMALFLRSFAPDLWNIVVRNRLTLTDQISFVKWSFNRSDEPNEAAVQLHSEMMTSVAGVQNGAGLVQLVVDAFPVLNNGISPRDRAEIKQLGPHISRPEYIDRYLFGALNPGDIPDSKVRSALRRLPAPEAGKELENFIAEDARGTVSKIFHTANAAPAEAGQIVHYLATRFDLFSDQVGNEFTSLERVVLNEVIRLLSRLNETQLANTLRPIYLQPDAASFIRELTDTGPGSYATSEPLKAFVLNRLPAVISSTADQLRESGRSPEVGSVERRRFVSLVRLDAGAAWRVAVEQIEAGAWHPADVATVVLSGARGTRGTRIYTNVESLTRLDPGAASFLRDHMPPGSYPESWSTAAPQLLNIEPTAEYARQIMAWALLDESAEAKFVGRDVAMRDDDDEP